MHARQKSRYSAARDRYTAAARTTVTAAAVVQDSVGRAARAVGRATAVQYTKKAINQKKPARVGAQKKAAGPRGRSPPCHAVRARCARSMRMLDARAPVDARALGRPALR